MSGVFVTGTDTGVGKTVVSCAVARGLRARGVDVGVMKPVETGVGPEGPLDAQALIAAAGVEDSIDQVCPQRFALPAAPTVAAVAEGRRVERPAIEKAFATLAARHEFLVVEGAGGLLVPAADELSMAELAAGLGLPLLVVARAALGTVNHTLLTLEAIETRGLGLVGVVISHAGGPLSAADASNLGALREALGERLIGEVPHLARDTLPAERVINLDAVLLGASQASGRSGAQ